MYNVFMAWHHIIPKHEWKKRFGNLDGVNAPDNFIDIYDHQHAQIHKHYYDEITHLEYDRVAYLGLTKQIGKEEATKMVVSIANTGRKHTEAQNQAKSKRHTGKKCHTDEFIKRAKKRMTGNQFSKGKKNPIRTCPHCGKAGGNTMSRWHFDNCKLFGGAQ